MSARVCPFTRGTRRPNPSQATLAVSPNNNALRDTIMLPHLRANLLLLALSVVLCCIVYPGILLIIGQTVFHDNAEGSILYDQNGTPIGSRLIAQPFSGEGY